MPHYPGLIRLLVAAPNRASAVGDMILTAAEAALLRACEFSSAAPGPWRIPPLPAALVRAYGLPKTLAAGTEAASTVGSATSPPPIVNPAVTDGDAEAHSSADSTAVSRRPVLLTSTGRSSALIPHRTARSPVRQAEHAKSNARRLEAARAHFGHVLLRVVPQIRTCPERPSQFGGLVGEAFTVRLEDPADVLHLVKDLEDFVRSWRPTRYRLAQMSKQNSVQLR